RADAPRRSAGLRWQGLAGGRPGPGSNLEHAEPSVGSGGGDEALDGRAGEGVEARDGGRVTVELGRPADVGFGFGLGRWKQQLEGIEAAAQNLGEVRGAALQ